MKILIVDDETMIIGLLEDMLSIEKYLGRA